MNMTVKWNYFTRDEIENNLKGIALGEIKRVIWETDSLDNDEKIAAIDGIIKVLDNTEKSLEEQDHD